MYRRASVIAAGGYDDSARLAEDYDLWLRLAEQGRLANLEEVALRVRYHATLAERAHAGRAGRADPADLRAGETAPGARGARIAAAAVASAAGPDLPPAVPDSASAGRPGGSESGAPRSRYALEGAGSSPFESVAAALPGPRDPAPGAASRSGDVTAAETLVSVVMPVFDAARCVEEAVASMLAQTHRDLELIAVDDGSRDGIARDPRAARARDPRIRVLRRAARGVIPARNAGAASARAGSWSPAWTPTTCRFRTASSAGRGDSERTRSAGLRRRRAFEVIDAKGRLIQRGRRRCDHDAIVADGADGPLRRSAASNATFRRDAALAIGGYDPERELRRGSRPLAAARRSRAPREPSRALISRVRFRDDSQSAVEQRGQLASARRIANRARARLGIRERSGRAGSLAPARHAPVAPRVCGGLGALGLAHRGAPHRARVCAARCFASSPLGAPLWKLLARGLAPELGRRGSAVR